MKINYILLFLLFLKTNCAIEPADWTPDDFMLPDLPQIELAPVETRCPVAGCQYNTKRKNDFARHIRYHTGNKPYACTAAGCNYRAVVNEALQNHKLSHLNKLPYECDICSHSTKTKKEIIVHMRTHTGEKPFECPIEYCTYRARQKGHISSHLKIHEGEKPFECPDCDYRTAHKHALTKHIKRMHE